MGVIYTVYLTRFRTYKIVLPPQTKTWEGRGPQRETPTAKSFLQDNFKEKPTFGTGVYYLFGSRHTPSAGMISGVADRNSRGRQRGVIR